jgi:hypothetical protein
MTLKFCWPTALTALFQYVLYWFTTLKDKLHNNILGLAFNQVTVEV